MIGKKAIPKSSKTIASEFIFLEKQMGWKYLSINRKFKKPYGILYESTNDSVLFLVNCPKGIIPLALIPNTVLTAWL